MDKRRYYIGVYTTNNQGMKFFESDLAHKDGLIVTGEVEKAWCTDDAVQLRKTIETLTDRHRGTHVFMSVWNTWPR